MLREMNGFFMTLIFMISLIYAVQYAGEASVNQRNHKNQRQIFSLLNFS